MQQTKPLMLGKYKLQEISRAFYIAVPKLWVTNEELTRGSVLQVVLEGDKLIISP